MSVHQSDVNNKDLPKDFSILWANVGRTIACHNAILNLAQERGVDVICVQEPSVQSGTSTQTNPAFQMYAPVDSWDWEDNAEKELVRPKVLTYVRNSWHIKIQQRRPVQCLDLLWLNVNGFAILNIYRQPLNDTVLNYVISLNPPEKCIIGGDFNVHHDLFEPGVLPHSRGGDLAAWSSASLMDYTGDPGVATHNEGHVLDLVFSNIPFTYTSICPELHCGSDHQTQVTLVPSYGEVPFSKPVYRVTEADLGKFAGIVDIGFQELQSPWNMHTTDELETFATAVREVFQVAIEKGGRSSKANTRGAGWWTDECKQAHTKYVSVKAADGIATEERKAFLATVRNAKRAFWRRIIDGASDSEALYKVVSWHKKSPKLKAPPLKLNGRVIEDTMEKAEVLREEVLGRFSAEDDIPDFDLESFEFVTYLPWETDLTLEEVERCTIGVTSTSPGTDGITVRLLKACWGSIKNKLHALFAKCLELSYFPTIWKEAEVAMIPKVGKKKDRSSVRSWRPIALLSCISKGFERVISKRLAWTALSENVFSQQHAGALPKRSAMDLVTSLVHNLELALDRKHKATLVTLDVKGAFDALLPNRLLKRMQNQGWPLSLVRLARSFLSGRRVRVRLEDCTTIFYDMECGTPQGSPLSPVLYMLYLAELLKQDPEHRFGYADDIAVFRTGPTLESNIEILEQEIKSIIQWGEENKVFFAPEKLEMIHFNRARLSTSPSLKINDNWTVKPITTAEKTGQHPALKWLGVYFDKKLRFKRHVQERVQSARKVAGHIRSLARTSSGPPASSLRKAVVTCVLSSALYGAEAWYAGKYKLATAGPRGEVVSARIGDHIDLIQSVITLAARGVLPVWKTAPMPTLMRDSGLPAAEVALEDLRARFGFRIQTVDNQHPLANRSTVQRMRTNARPRLTKVQGAAELITEVPRPAVRLPHYGHGCREDPTLGIDKKTAAQHFKTWVKTLPVSDILVYSDGSEQWNNGVHSVGYGYVIYQDGRKVGDGLGTIHNLSHVFDAEAIGAWKGLEAALRLPTSRSSRIWMCVDSTSVIWCLRGNASSSSQWAFHCCQDTFSSVDVRIKWSPGHTGIQGNEEADALADAAADPKHPSPCSDPRSHQPTVSGVRSEARGYTKNATERWWRIASAKLSDRYKVWGLPYVIKVLPELELPRNVLQRILAIRTGHGDFAWYHTKFKHKDAKLVCSCGSKKTPDHLVHCRRVFRYLYNWPFKPKRPPRTREEGIGYIQKLIHKPQNFYDFLQVTSFYDKVCTR